MSNKGGLPAIDPYIIARNHWLQEIRMIRAFKRVHGISRERDRLIYQKELCKLRKEKYK